MCLLAWTCLVVAADLMDLDPVAVPGHALLPHRPRRRGLQPRLDLPSAGHGQMGSPVQGRDHLSDRDGGRVSNSAISATSGAGAAQGRQQQLGDDEGDEKQVQGGSDAALLLSHLTHHPQASPRQRPPSSTLLTSPPPQQQQQQQPLPPLPPQRHQQQRDEREREDNTPPLTSLLQEQEREADRRRSHAHPQRHDRRGASKQTVAVAPAEQGSGAPGGAVAATLVVQLARHPKPRSAQVQLRFGEDPVAVARQFCESNTPLLPPSSGSADSLGKTSDSREQRALECERQVSTALVNLSRQGEAVAEGGWWRGLGVGDRDNNPQTSSGAASLEGASRSGKADCRPSSAVFCNYADSCLHPPGFCFFFLLPAVSATLQCYPSRWRCPLGCASRAGQKF